ncbi:hypothetical protein COY17_03040, partial [Candidatus Saccharibacteria bacterium CG_4_10_14_0_2_um_filter_52_9]
NFRFTGTATAARTITLPDATGTLCLSIGNCAGSGGGITGSGTSGSIAKFNGTGSITNSSLTESGTTLTYAGNAVINAGSGFTGNLIDLKLNGVSKFSVDQTGAVTGTSFSGTGTGLTALNGSNITSGTVADGRLSTNVTLAGNTFNGVSQLVQTTGAGALPALSGVNLTSLNGSNIASGTVADARLSSNVALLNGTNSFTGTSNSFSNTLNASGGITVGVAGSVVGSVSLANATSSRLIILQGLNPSGVGNATVQIPMTAGGSTDIVCLATLSNCSGVNGGSGNTAYIFNQTSQQASSNFNISGAGVIGTTLTVSGLSSAGIVHSSAAGLLSTSAIVNADLQSGSFGSITGVGTLTGGLNIATGQTYKINSIDINTSGTLSNVAYLSQANNFTAANTFSAAGTALTVTNNALVSGALTVSGAINANGGTVTGTGVLAVSSGGTSGLTLTAASGILQLGGSTATIQRVGSLLTLEVVSASASTLSIINSGGGVASLAVQGSVSTGGTARLSSAGLLQNVSLGANTGAIVASSTGALSNANGATASQCLLSNGVATAPSFQSCPTALGAWSTTGNAGTTVGTNFVGTTDNQALLIQSQSTTAHPSSIQINPSGADSIGAITIAGNGPLGSSGGGTDWLVVQDASATPNQYFGISGSGANARVRAYLQPGANIGASSAVCATASSGLVYLGGCNGGGAGVTSVNTGTGAITIQGTASQISVSGTTTITLAGAGTTLSACSAGTVLSGSLSGGILGSASCVANGADLQGAYNTGNTITTTNARNIAFTLADTATDSNFITNVASGSTSKFAVQYNGADTFSISNATGSQGAALFKNSTNSTTAFQIQNASSQNIFQVDTSTNNINVLGNLTNSALSGSGDIGTWGTTTAMSNGQGGGFGMVTSYNGYVYRIGGYDTTLNGVQSNISYAKINVDGTVGAWTTNANSLAAARTNASAVALNGYIYVIGGSANLDTPTATNTVYYSRINADGSLGTWGTTTTTNLPNRYEHQSIAYNGYIYVVGGAATGSSRVDGTNGTATSYYAKQNPDGTLSAWTAGTSMGANKTNFSLLQANGYMYAIGGLAATGTTGTTAVYKAKINTDGTLAAWSADTATTTQIRYAQAGVAADGYLYQIGGQNTGTALSTTSYARVNTDGTLGTWYTSTKNLPSSVLRQGTGAIATNGNINFISGYDNTGTTVNTNYYVALSRLKVAASLDLVGYSGSGLGDASAGGELTAGNTIIAGALNVQGDSNFNSSINAYGNLSVAGAVAFRNATNSTTA